MAVTRTNTSMADHICCQMLASTLALQLASGMANILPPPLLLLPPLPSPLLPPFLAASPGKCQSGICVGMKANIDAAAQGQTEPVIFKARFASTAGLNGATQVVLHGRKGNATDGIGDELGILYDDGQRVHDDRYAGDGLFSNVIFIEFPKTSEAVYRNFYVSLLDKDVSSQGEFMLCGRSLCEQFAARYDWLAC
jgi:hypothetical protein